ncbi:hypothetical protein Y024_4483 [Burkholderia pseudomallei TSV44]|nr:hypothetical protein Y024_4483 [Burkholderia pseudomallei TSV44]
MRIFARRCGPGRGDFVWNMTGILGSGAKIRCIECRVRRKNRVNRVACMARAACRAAGRAAAQPAVEGATRAC